jgi:glucose/arabinose dehydrogenase
MKKVISGCLIFGLLFNGCSTNEQQNPADISKDTQQPNVTQEEAVPLPIENLEVIAENLDVPWSIENFENTFYLTERPGNIVKIENDALERQNVVFKKDLATAAEAGLLGFALAPDFPESNEAYAYYTYVDSSGQFNRIVTLHLENDIWREGDLLLDKIPSGSYHHGGRIKIGPDGKLYVTTGDATERDIAQDLGSLGGKILRMDLDGSIPSDNPYPDSYIFSLGHRNPQGMTWTSDDVFYGNEHGDNANDEVNRIVAGQNYGWPIIEGYQEQADLISPLFTSGNKDTWAPSGMDYNDGKLYVAALRGSAVMEFDLETNQNRQVITGFGRIQDVLIADGYLYFISNNSDGRGNPAKNDDRLYRTYFQNLIDYRSEGLNK